LFWFWYLVEESGYAIEETVTYRLLFFLLILVIVIICAGANAGLGMSLGFDGGCWVWALQGWVLDAGEVVA
jgi:hypothetical protein